MRHGDPGELLCRAIRHHAAACEALHVPSLVVPMYGEPAGTMYDPISRHLSVRGAALAAQVGRALIVAHERPHFGESRQ